MYTIAKGYRDFSESALAVPEIFRVGKRYTNNKNTEYVVEFNACLYKIRAYETDILGYDLDVDFFEFSEEVVGAERLKIGALLVELIFSKTVNDAILAHKIDCVEERFLDETASYNDAIFVKMLAVDAEKRGASVSFRNL